MNVPDFVAEVSWDQAKGLFVMTLSLARKYEVRISVRGNLEPRNPKLVSRRSLPEGISLIQLLFTPNLDESYTLRIVDSSTDEQYFIQSITVPPFR
jgi:hypothetical protein